MPFILSLFCFFLSTPAWANVEEKLLLITYAIAILIQTSGWLMYSFFLALIFTIFKGKVDEFEKKWVAIAFPLWFLQIFSCLFLNDYSYKVKFELGYAVTDDSTTLIFVTACSFVLVLSLILFFQKKKIAGACLLLFILVMVLAYPQIVEWSAKREAFHQMSQNPIIQVPGVSEPYRQGFTVPHYSGGALTLSADGLSEQRISFPEVPGAVPLNPGKYKVCLTYKAQEPECYLISLKAGLLVRFNKRESYTYETSTSEAFFRCLPQEACEKL